ATSDLYFTPQQDAHSIQYSTTLPDGQTATITYTLPENEYMMQCQVQLTGMPAATLPMSWKVTGLHTEKDVENERISTQVYYQFADGDEDYFTIKEEEKKTLDKSVKWIGYRQLYFSSAFITEQDAFTTVQMNTNTATG